MFRKRNNKMKTKFKLKPPDFKDIEDFKFYEPVIYYDYRNVPKEKN